MVFPLLLCRATMVATKYICIPNICAVVAPQVLSLLLSDLSHENLATVMFTA